MDENARYRLLVDAIKDYAIYMLDADGYVVNWNAGAQRFKGYTADEIVGKHFSLFYREVDRLDKLPERALHMAATEGKFEAEGWRLRKDGTPFWASVVIDPVRGKDGALIGFAKITRDLTERRETQLALEKAREALFQAQKMEAIGQLTGGVAHDFNNLLTATLGSLELLRKRLPDDPAALRLLDNAIAGAERGAVLTQRMLAFARRQDLKPVRVEIPDLVRGMTDLLQRSVGATVQIETHFPLNLGPVSADINQLEMALLNLSVNARDAMPDGGTITIGAQNRLALPDNVEGVEPGHYIALSVVDTGVGMTADTLARAMEPFFTTKGVGRGTGLGLPMVHGLAEQLGGRLILESVLGEGTTATLMLPVAAANDVMPVSKALEPSTRLARSLKILAVDDDSLVLMNTVALLQDLGHEVIEAYSGDEALAIFRREPDIDLVITDQIMPHMTGTEFAEAALAERPGVPFILASGYGELPAGDNVAWLKLSKPFRQDELERVVADVWARPGVAASA